MSKLKGRKLIHERYHRKTTSQYKIIKDNNFTYRIIIPVINKYLNDKKTKILDIGCGAGTLGFYLANKGYDITGIDISEKAIQSCKQTAKNLGLKNIKFKTVDFPNQTFPGKYNLVLCTEVIEHLENDELAVKQIYKMLSPGGILILTTPSIYAPLHRLGLTTKFDKEVGHLRRYDPDNLKKIVTSSRLTIKEINIEEGLARNLLFINPVAGMFVRLINHGLSDLYTKIDKIFLNIFGGSNIIIVAIKK